jgi:hypothetical protein
MGHYGSKSSLFFGFNPPLEAFSALDLDSEAPTGPAWASV